MHPIPPPQMFLNYSSGYPDPRSSLLSPYDPNATYYYTPGSVNNTNQQHPSYFTNLGGNTSGRNYSNGNLYPNVPSMHNISNVSNVPNGFRLPPMQTAPRPYFTITQFNYQPMGYHQARNPGGNATNLVFGAPARERRYTPDSQCRYFMESQFEIGQSQSSTLAAEPPNILYQKSSSGLDETMIKRNDLKSCSTDSFEFTIQPEQIVNALYDDKEQDCVQCRNHTEPSAKINKEPNKNQFGAPCTWTDCEVMDPMRIEDDDLTKFIVDGCLKAEAIAVRNQHRPCFKNIKHLCTRTRTDILKPRTTVANIHSQGIPWATKDFIFAFVRLINCWYILKGYLDDHEGSLGKIETTLIPEFKECYQRWQTINKDMVKHLINIFVNLDNGITVQNAEIFSTFNNLSKNNKRNEYVSTFTKDNGDNKNTLLTPTNDLYPEQSNSQASLSTKLSIQEQLIFQNPKVKNANSCDPVGKNTYYLNNNNSNLYMAATECIEEKLKYLEGQITVPGILRVKEMYTTNATIVQEKNIEDLQTTITTANEMNTSNNIRMCSHHKIYMKPGSYRVPKKKISSSTSSPNNEENPSVVNPQPECTNESTEEQNEVIWKTALDTLRPFMEQILKETEINKMLSNFSNQQNNHSNHSNVMGCETNVEIPSKIRETLSWLDEHAEDLKNVNFGKEEGVKLNSNKLEKHLKHQTENQPYKKRSEDEDNSNKNCKPLNHSELTSPHDNIITTTDSAMCFLSRSKLGLPPIIVGKFEKIINALWNLQFARYITFEINAENVPDYYKYINKPMFLYKVMNNLKQNKYNHPYQVVHDLRTIVRNSELYIEKRPDSQFEKYLNLFSKELEYQLAEKFATIDFSSVTGDPLQPPKIEICIFNQNTLEEK